MDAWLLILRFNELVWNWSVWIVYGMLIGYIYPWMVVSYGGNTWNVYGTACLDVGLVWTDGT